jgi:hypothetical protein
MAEDLRLLIYKIQAMAKQLGFVIQEIKMDDLWFIGKKRGLIEASGLTNYDVAIEVKILPFVQTVQDAQVIVKLTPLKDDGTPKLGSNVIKTIARHAEFDIQELLSEYFR